MPDKVQPQHPVPASILHHQPVVFSASVIAWLITNAQRGGKEQPQVTLNDIVSQGRLNFVMVAGGLITTK
jgi:hypothetical protein